MNASNAKTVWQQYEAGRDYKRRSGLYARIRENERFWRGDQWSGDRTDLPKPVFNVVHRVVEHLICSILANTVTIRYSDDGPAADQPAAKAAISRGCAVMPL